MRIASSASALALASASTSALSSAPFLVGIAEHILLSKDVGGDLDVLKYSQCLDMHFLEEQALDLLRLEKHQ